MMALLAILPLFGASIIWAPAALFLALQGNWGQALILTAWCGIVVALIDNLIYPMLVGKDLRLHTLPVFIAIVGGLVVFGASGLILGPLVLAVTLATWISGTSALKAGAPRTTKRRSEANPFASVRIVLFALLPEEGETRSGGVVSCLRGVAGVAAYTKAVMGKRPKSSNPETVACRQCGTEVPKSAAKSSEGRDHLQHFCSDECHRKWADANRKPQGV